MKRVYEDKSKCSGCNTCLNVCPTKAIKMVEDEYGFLYPHISEEICIDCNKCKKYCPMRHVSDEVIERAYAAKLTSKEIENSASGGAFYALARAFIENNGVVYGCAFDDELIAKHIKVTTCNDLSKLQGSKYVQSNLNVHFAVLEDLKVGREVLFSGTPCQVAAIKSFVGNLSDRLFTVELVCHGVPNSKLWKDYIDFLEKDNKGKIINFKFRVKHSKTKFCARYTIVKDGVEKECIIPSNLSYYYYSFLKGKTYRTSCYSCPYAQPNRQADVTICDFWGYNGNYFAGSTDVSAVLIQGVKGNALFEMGRKYLDVEETKFQNVADNNEQLQKPSDISKYDARFFETWIKKGSRALEAEHKKKHWKAYLLNNLYRIKRL